MVFQTLMARTYLNIMFLKPKKTKKYIGLTSMLIPIIQMNILKIQLGFLLEEVRNIQEVRNVQEVKNVQDVGAVHKEQEEVGVLRKRLVETQELMLEVLQEVIEEENHLRLQYKTQLMDIKNFNDRVYNSYAQVPLIRMIMMNSKKQNKYFLLWNFLNSPNFIGLALTHLKNCFFLAKLFY